MPQFVDRIEILNPAAYFDANGKRNVVARVTEALDSVVAGIKLNEVGFLNMTLPLKYFSTVTGIEDCIIEIWLNWRDSNGNQGASPFLFGKTGFNVLREPLPRVDIVNDQFTFEARCNNTRMTERVVAKYAGTAKATFTGLADNGIKRIMRDAQVDDLTGGSTWTPAIDRDFNNALGVDADTSQGGATVNKDFAWAQDLPSLFRTLSEESVQKGGNRVLFGIETLDAPGALGANHFLQFKTWATRRGADRRKDNPGGNPPVILSNAWGNFVPEELAVPFPTTNGNGAGNVTLQYAAGQGESTARDVKKAENTVALSGGTSPFRLKEAFKDARNSAAVAMVQGEADAELRNSRPRPGVRGTVQETDSTIYGRDFLEYDTLTVVIDKEYLAPGNNGQFDTLERFYYEFDVTVEAVKLTINAGIPQVEVTLKTDG